MTNELELMAMGVVPCPSESPDGVPQWNAPRGTTIAESAAGEYVLASDYGALEAERDQLRAQVEALRAALEKAAKGVHWLQAHVPMGRDAQWHAYHTRDDIEAALQAPKCDP